tara:strand:+ start:1452 stop:1715 length:264 start_codon:yes stop_codon:yes gene_type:complete
MPRYCYKCSKCEKEQMIVHLIKQKIENCPVCEGTNCMQKQLTTPSIKTTLTQAEPSVGEVTKEFIEANREVLKTQKEEALKEQYGTS